LNNAISQIGTNDTQWKSFLDNGKVKITQYYEAKCDEILAKGDALIKTEEYEKAIAYLLMTPEEVSSCFAKAQAKALEAFRLLKEKNSAKLLNSAKMAFEKGNYVEAFDLIEKIDPNSISFTPSQNLIKTNQEKFCKQLILKAKTAIAIKDYFGASETLKDLNPDSSCLKDAQELIKEIESKVSAEDKQNNEIKKLQYQDQVMLKKEEIIALKEIAVEYAKSQPKSITSNTIMK
jgi:hypothetical protein